MDRAELYKNYVDTGKLSQRIIHKNGSSYEIYCYTKQAFFAFDWDETLISHRGKIYKLNPPFGHVEINNPIPKIFNLGEHPSATLEALESNMEKHSYEVLDKVNGHLVIVSPDASSGFRTVLVSTKGSFEGELVQQDEEMLHKMGVIRRIKHYSLNYTFMFECIGEYDKHLHYEDQKEKYGGMDTMVLLAATYNNTGEELNYHGLQQMAFMLGCPVVQRMNLDVIGKDVNKWFEHKGIEGYVIHFPELQSRIKVKTTEYTTLRYFKEMTSEKLVNALYNSGLENLYINYDEEVYPIIDSLKLDMIEFILESVSNVSGKIAEGHCFDRKELGTSKEYTKMEKSYIFMVIKGMFPGDIFDSFITSKDFRLQFKEQGVYRNTEEAIKNLFDKRVALLRDDITV